MESFDQWGVRQNVNLYKETKTNWRTSPVLKPKERQNIHYGPFHSRGVRNNILKTHIFAQKKQNSTVNFKVKLNCPRDIKSRNTAPGPDGIPFLILKNLPVFKFITKFKNPTSDWASSSSAKRGASSDDSPYYSGIHLYLHLVSCVKHLEDS